MLDRGGVGDVIGRQRHRRAERKKRACEQVSERNGLKRRRLREAELSSERQS